MMFYVVQESLTKGIPLHIGGEPWSRWFYSYNLVGRSGAAPDNPVISIKSKCPAVHRDVQSYKNLTSIDCPPILQNAYKIRTQPWNNVPFKEKIWIPKITIKFRTGLPHFDGSSLIDCEPYFLGGYQPWFYSREIPLWISRVSQRPPFYRGTWFPL